MSKIDSQLKVESLALHGGWEPDPATGARALPIYQTTSFQFKSTEHAANLFGLREFGNIYTRIMNPTQDAFEKRIVVMDGSVRASLFRRQSRDDIAPQHSQAARDVSRITLRGTYNLFHYTFPRLE
jgi:O-acetylhomoserine (thiol)-lyase